MMTSPAQEPSALCRAMRAAVARLILALTASARSAGFALADGFADGAWSKAASHTTRRKWRKGERGFADTAAVDPFLIGSGVWALFVLLHCPNPASRPLNT